MELDDGRGLQQLLGDLSDGRSLICWDCFLVPFVLSFCLICVIFSSFSEGEGGRG